MAELWQKNGAAGEGFEDILGLTALLTGNRKSWVKRRKNNGSKNSDFCK